ncbi:MAG: hypothetical protein K2G34_02320, partial [Bacteroides sp.]|nr:hypothetical protein [Bacteroides sp.]
ICTIRTHQRHHPYPAEASGHAYMYENRNARMATGAKHRRRRSKTAQKAEERQEKRNEKTD